MLKVDFKMPSRWFALQVSRAIEIENLDRQETHMSCGRVAASRITPPKNAVAASRAPTEMTGRLLGGILQASAPVDSVSSVVPLF
jgi:hypothetical protein